jgi:ADP-dependent NAD(P)H-hydrate dehydratase / NAD(P)H-hydrate epimerase
MKVLTADQMGYVDRTTIERGVPGIELMRNAGSAVYEFIAETLGISRKAGIVVLAGRGNNGGDGFRVAELLVRNGFDTEVYLVGKKTDVSGDAAVCMKDAEAGGMKVTEITGENDIDRLSEKLMFVGIIVDALFGTGLKGEITGLSAAIIDSVNSSEAEVIAVDIPSGVNASTGEKSVHTMQADYTITFGCLKVGHLGMPGRLACGDVNVVNIGFSPEVIDSVTPFANTLSTAEAAQHIPCRAYNAHKGSTGHVFVIAGSVGMSGAAALVSRAAMLAGAGVVTVGCPRSLNDILEIKLTEVMTFPLPEVRKKRCLSMRALGLLRKSVQKADVVTVGPGLGTYYETKELVRRFISEYNGRIVLDADGINAFEGDMESLRSAPCEIVITPHAGELAKLTGISIGDIIADPFKASQKASEATGKIVLLKGSPTVISDPSGTTWINSTGNEGMATAGMGDVLTGTISGLAAQKLDLYNAAILGAYVHGLAGEIVSEKKGIHGVMAGDVLESLPDALLEILNENNTMKKSGEYVEN